MSEAESKGLTAGPAPVSGPDADAHPQPPAAVGTPRMDIQAYIGTRLREVYDDVASQPIPDRFLDLMRQLDGK